VTETDKGLAIKTEGGKRISVSVSSHYDYSSDSYLALPLIEYTDLEEYIYYAVTPDTNITGLMNRVLIVGAYNNTSITVISTQKIYIRNTILEANIEHELSLDRLETLLLESESPLTGQINPSQMISYGYDKQLFITIIAIEHTVMEFRVTPINLEGKLLLI